jgi:hypothetical protein
LQALEPLPRVNALPEGFASRDPTGPEYRPRERLFVKLPTLSGRQRSFGACDSGNPLPPQGRQAISDSNRYDVRALQTCAPLKLEFRHQGSVRHNS